MKCPDCAKSLPLTAAKCRCGWRSDLSKAAEQLAPTGPLCVGCRGQLAGGYTAMHCGHACRHCWNAYLEGRWNGGGYSEARETLRLEWEKRNALPATA